jgi:hypothetical protein
VPSDITVPGSPTIIGVEHIVPDRSRVGVLRKLSLPPVALQMFTASIQTCQEFHYDNVIHALLGFSKGTNTTTHDQMGYFPLFIDEKGRLYFDYDVKGLHETDGHRDLSVVLACRLPRNITRTQQHISNTYLYNRDTVMDHPKPGELLILKPYGVPFWPFQYQNGVLSSTRLPYDATKSIESPRQQNLPVVVRARDEDHRRGSCLVWIVPDEEAYFRHVLQPIDSLRMAYYGAVVIFFHDLMQSKHPPAWILEFLYYICYRWVPALAVMLRPLQYYRKKEP